MYSRSKAIFLDRHKKVHHLFSNACKCSSNPGSSVIGIYRYIGKKTIHPYQKPSILKLVHVTLQRPEYAAASASLFKLFIINLSDNQKLTSWRGTNSCTFSTFQIYLHFCQFVIQIIITSFQLLDFILGYGKCHEQNP